MAQHWLDTYAARQDRDRDTDLLIDDLQGLLDDLRDHAARQTNAEIS